jgi:hypothetical protein
MKITKSFLKQVIKEEIDKMEEEAKRMPTRVVRLKPKFPNEEVLSVKFSTGRTIKCKIKPKEGQQDYYIQPIIGGKQVVLDDVEKTEILNFVHSESFKPRYIEKF